MIDFKKRKKIILTDKMLPLNLPALYTCRLGRILFGYATVPTLQGEDFFHSY